MIVYPETVITDAFECRAVDSIRDYPRICVTAELVLVGKVANAKFAKIDKGNIERLLVSAVCDSVTLDGMPKKDGAQ